MGPGDGEGREVHGPGALRRESGGAHGQHFRTEGAGTRGRLARWGPLVIETEEKENPEKGKMEFDFRYTCLYFAFLNELKAEF